MIEITRIDRRLAAGGLWVTGTVGEFEFSALDFREHADTPDFELAGSRISKLWMRYQGRVVFNWDRGPDVEPASDEVQDAVVRLCTELADHVCIDVGGRIRLVEMVDDPDPVPPGTVTAVGYHQDWMQVQVDWNNGRRLMVSVPPDRVTRL